jgi:hypothetical protein
VARENMLAGDGLMSARCCAMVAIACVFDVSQ